MTGRQIILRFLCLSAILTGTLGGYAQEELEEPMDSVERKLQILDRLQTMLNDAKQIYVNSLILPPAGKEGKINLPMANAMAEKVKTAEKALKSLDFKWNTYYQSIQMEVADNEELMNEANTVQQIKQSVSDTLTAIHAKVELLQAFCKAEDFLPTQEKTYKELSEKATALSMTAQLGPQLEKLKSQEQLTFTPIQQQYDKAKEAVQAMPGLKKRMEAVDQAYIALKAQSDKIQKAEYKPWIERIKDYLMGFAAVAILLMFANMVSSKIQAIKQARENMKKMKDMMNGGNKFYPTICLLPFFLFLLTGCDEKPEWLGWTHQEKADTTMSMTLSKPVFSDDWKTITVDASIGDSIRNFSLADSRQERFEVTEHIHHLKKRHYKLAPKLVKVENVAVQQVKKIGLKMLVLVDLTLPQEAITQEYQAVVEMRNLFADHNLYVAFITGTEVTESMPVSDYVLKTYFKQETAKTKYLLRSIVTKMNEVVSGADWTVGAKHIAMTILSDGETYQGDLPMDPQHFELEHQLADDTLSCPLFFAKFQQEKAAQEPVIDFENLSVIAFDDDEDVGILRSACLNSKGLYQHHFSWADIKDNLGKKYHVKFVDFRFTLENPDNKVYRGRDGRDLLISCYDAETDSILAKGAVFYKLGSIYEPIIVNGRPLRTILITGIAYTLFLILAVYLILQLLVPYLQYRWFLKKHVITYRGPLMGKDGGMIGESCYLCKAPFEADDKVVKKCKHPMHLSCWEENQGQCPEYGRHCQEGRHYYNRHQLFDPDNAPFYMRWMLVAILAGLASWISYHILTFIHIPRDPLAAFGLSIGFFLTLMLSYMSVPRRDSVTRAIRIALRAVLGGIGGLLFFLFGNMLDIKLGFQDNWLLIDWVPWILTAYWIVLCVVWKTSIRVRHTMLIAAIVIGFISTYLWAWLYEGATVDYRITLLTNFILFAVIMAIGIAREAPRSERYFLTASGSVKQIDIALYKWFRANPAEHVTIGHSVDCNLHLSWDIQSKIAPIQAEIYIKYGTPWLHTLEDGVVVDGKTLGTGKMLRLYHGRSFTIGKTTFTYVEKDK